MTLRCVHLCLLCVGVRLKCVEAQLQAATEPLDRVIQAVSQCCGLHSKTSIQVQAYNYRHVYLWKCFKLVFLELSTTFPLFTCCSLNLFKTSYWYEIKKKNNLQKTLNLHYLPPLQQLKGLNIWSRFIWLQMFSFIIILSIYCVL